MRKKEFVAVAFDLQYEIFVVYITFLSSDSSIHLLCRAQIALLKADKAFILVLSEYANFINILSSNLIAKLSKHTKINDYATHLKKGQQPPYGPIYNIRPVK